MQISGERVTRTRLVRTDRFVVAVDVSMVIPDADPSEPCLEPGAVELLKEVQQRAEAGDVDWLRSRGRVYEALDVVV